MMKHFFCNVSFWSALFVDVLQVQVILFFNHVYYTSHLDIVSYPLVALCGMIVTLFDSLVSFFLLLFLFLMGYLCLFLSHGLTKLREYYFNFYFLVLQAYLPLD